MKHFDLQESFKVDDVEHEAVVEEVAQHCSDFLLQTWLLMDRMLPEQFAQIRNAPRIIPSSERGRWLDTSYSNFMLFLCIADTLDENGSLTMGELTRAISMSDTTATRVVDWMADCKYAERFTASDDRRHVRVALTDEGRNLSKAAKRYLFDRALEFLSGLPQETVDALKTVLEELP